MVSRYVEDIKLNVSFIYRTKHVERDLHEKVLAKYKLHSLSKDDSISPACMITCLEHLLASSDDSRLTFANIDLQITHYYSVLSDGTVCIPYNWTMG